ncbi:MAG TPA: glycerol-3-phosphate 1-O-acyltransferase PlsY, partial [Verrucomicrobiae bacterium]|nr:glycerol-3-phosphate 1-O-acyltransferase PlsY [Verrucomicrobiae bacterium]
MTGYFLTALVAYLIGSIPTGYLFGRARGIDIRTAGSGNIGATNVFRTLGKTAGVAVLVIDAVKGFVPAKFLIFGADPGSRELHAMVAGFFSIIGHNYTCWLRFKGGKGIATSAGVLVALVPLALLITFAGWLLVFAISRYVSLASIVAALFLPFAAWGLGRSDRIILLCSVLSLLAIYKHKANIQRLLAGTEHRFGAKK